jgi:hypothetical protein
MSNIFFYPSQNPKRLAYTYTNKHIHRSKPDHIAENLDTSLHLSKSTDFSTKIGYKTHHVSMHTAIAVT